jgi:hypothetical protein
MRCHEDWQCTQKRGGVGGGGHRWGGAGAPVGLKAGAGGSVKSPRTHHLKAPRRDSATPIFASQPTRPGNHASRGTQPPGTAPLPAHTDRQPMEKFIFQFCVSHRPLPALPDRSSRPHRGQDAVPGEQVLHAFEALDEEVVHGGHGVLPLHGVHLERERGGGSPFRCTWPSPLAASFHGAEPASG